MEVWKTIPGFEKYQVSNLGRVRSFRGITERIMKSSGIKYKQIGLSIKGKVYYFLIHRLVAEAFIPNPDNLPFVNHKNEDKTDNRVENLEWCTAKYNMTYNNIQWRRTEGRRKKISQFTKDGIFIKEWDCATTASVALNLQRRHICACCNGQRKTCGGFKWQYAA